MPVWTKTCFSLPLTMPCRVTRALQHGDAGVGRGNPRITKPEQFDTRKSTELQSLSAAAPFNLNAMINIDTTVSPFLSMDYRAGFLRDADSNNASSRAFSSSANSYTGLTSLKSPPPARTGLSWLKCATILWMEWVCFQLRWVVLSQKICRSDGVKSMISIVRQGLLLHGLDEVN